jgi:hypothetical protein
LDLPEDVRGRVRGGELTAAHAVALGKYKPFPRLASRLSEMAAASGWTSRDLEGKLPNAWYTLEREGVVRGMHDARFDTSVCRERCPYDAYRREGYAGGVCLRPEHYAELQAAAEAEAEARLRERTRAGAAEATEGAGVDLEDAERLLATLPSLRELRYGDYVDLSKEYSRPPEGCTGACPCRGRAVGCDGGEVAICTAPKRYQQLKGAQTRRSNKAARAALKAKREALPARIDAIAGFGPGELALLVEAATDDYHAGAAFEEAAGRAGIPLAKNHHGYTERGREALGSLGPLIQLRLAIEALIRRELKAAHDAGSDATPLHDWLWGPEEPAGGEDPEVSAVGG